MGNQNSYIDQTKVFAHLDRLQGWRDGHKPAPVTLEWDLSNRCNLGCEMCHMAYTHARGPLTGKVAGPEGSTPTGDLADADMVCRALGEAAQAGVKGIVWAGGGEPTLHPEFERITRRARDVGLEQGMYTHGGHVTAEKGALIKEVFTWVVVSLDRSDADSYRAYKGGGPRGFEKAVAGAKNLVGGAATIGLSFLVDSTTWQDMPRNLAFAQALGVNYTTFRPMIQFDQAHPSHVTEDRAWITEAEPLLREMGATAGVVCDVDRFLEYRDWTGHHYPACFGIRLNATVTPDGRIWLCCNRRGFAGSEVGDLRKQSFTEIWASHPGQWTDYRDCRVMCRLHLVNTELARIEAPRQHISFV